MKISSYGYWDLCKSTDGTHYLISYPIQEAGVSRRSFPYLMVAKFPNKSPEVSVSPGHPYKASASAAVVVSLSHADAKRVQHMVMSGSGNIAWCSSSKFDVEMIESFKLGSKVVITSESTDNKSSTDTYSLMGFTEAYRILTSPTKAP